MTDRKYIYCAVGLMASISFGNLLPRVPAVKGVISRIFFDPVSVFWIIVSLAIWFLLPRIHIPGRLRLRHRVWGMACSGAVIFLALRFAAGFLLDSIALSPYDLSPLGILFNLFSIVPAIAALEMVRAYLLGTACRYPQYKWIFTVVITLAFCLFEVNYTKVTVLKSSEDWFVFVAKDVLPLIAQSSLLTVLVLYGGAASGMIYSGVLGVFTRLFPFLPSLPWIAESALGITFPVLMALFLRGWYRYSANRHPAGRKESIGSFVSALVIVVSFTWFVVGVFPIYPSVILTGSMEPEIFPGDVILIQKFVNEREIYNLSENDMINFKRGNVIVTHRIVEVLYDEDGNISFRTKGDNNKFADEEIVLPADINGIVKGIIPKIGIPVLWMYGNAQIPEGVSDN